MLTLAPPSTHLLALLALGWLRRRLHRPDRHVAVGPARRQPAPAGGEEREAAEEPLVRGDAGGAAAVVPEVHAAVGSGGDEHVIDGEVESAVHVRDRVDILSREQGAGSRDYGLWIRD